MHLDQIGPTTLLVCAAVLTLPAEREHQVELAGRELRLTDLDKVLWPDVHFTKRRTLAYYHAVAPVLLPHLNGRTVLLARFPEGVTGPGLYQRRCRGTPGWLKDGHRRGRDGRRVRSWLIEDEASLLWAVNAGAIELHTFAGHADRPLQPRELRLELEPLLPSGLLACCWQALALRDRLAAHGLRALVKSSGLAGLHVTVPLDSTATFAETRSFAHGLVESVAGPRLVASQADLRSARVGDVEVSWAGNDAHRAAIAPYSLRAGRTPTSAAPLDWTEVERAVLEENVDALRFGPFDVLARLTAMGDPFAATAMKPQRLRARRRGDRRSALPPSTWTLGSRRSSARPRRTVV